MKVAVLFGGVSTEHEVSCRSAFFVTQALREAGHEVYPVGISRDGEWIPFLTDLEEMTKPDWADRARSAWAWRQAAENSSRSTAVDHCISCNVGAENVEDPGRFRGCGHSAGGFSPRRLFSDLLGVQPDVIFPAVHGINCEDGSLQGLLELTAIPYVGCRVLASALGMEKVYTKRIWAQAGLPVLPSVVVTRSELAEEKSLNQMLAVIEEQLHYPVFLKISSGGSSVGTCMAKNRTELHQGLLDVSQYGPQILVEPFVKARELEVAVLGNEDPVAAQVGEIVKQDHVLYYDYSSKYVDENSAVARVPADIPEELNQRLRILACEAYRCLNARGLARVDFFWQEETGRISLNEINTLPGFTSISLYPKAWEQAGMRAPELVTRLCELAVEEFASSKRREE